MNENITIKEAKEARKKLHEQLTKAVLEFTNKTGLGVDRIHIDHIDNYQGVVAYQIWTDIKMDLR